MKANRIKLKLTLILLYLLFNLVCFETICQAATQAKRNWGHYVTNCLDTLIDHGRDVYGSVQSPLFMSVIDTKTLIAPEKPDAYDSLLRLEGRITRRGERGSNVWHDQALLHTMYQVSNLTGDKRYAREADRCLDYFLKNCRKKNGLLIWGSHIHWDCYQDQLGGDKGPHEILVTLPLWKEMYRINPEAIRKEIDGIWKWHVYDKTTGAHNRHDSGSAGVDFSFSGSSFIQAFAFLYSVTGAQEYLDKAKLIADWHWRHRNTDTNLTSENPSRKDSGAYLYSKTFMTTLTGPHAAALLRSYEITGEKHFLDIAVAYIKAFDKYGWNEKEQMYYGMINLDGTPTTEDEVPASMRSQLAGPGRKPNPGYSVPPVGPVDVWQTTIFPLLFPLNSAQSALYAYEITAKDNQAGDPALLKAAQHWAIVIEKQLPPQTGWTFKHALEASMPKVKKTGGTYAINYGRAISFYVHLYRASQERKYLKLAEDIAQEAVAKLYVETVKNPPQGKPKTYGIFKGHPAKPYYESTNGVGILLYALLELDKPESNFGGAF